MRSGHQGYCTMSLYLRQVLSDKVRSKIFCKDFKFFKTVLRKVVFIAFVKYTVKLGYYVHGLVRTLGYNVLSVDHEHRQSENMYIFFRIRRTERGTKSDITYQFSLQEHFFALSLALFFWSRAYLPLPFSFDFNFPARFQVHDARKAISPYEERVMNDIQNGEASSVADRSREHVEPVIRVSKIVFWIERTLVTTYLFSFPLRVRNNRVSLYNPDLGRGLIGDSRPGAFGPRALYSSHMNFKPFMFLSVIYFRLPLTFPHPGLVPAFPCFRHSLPYFGHSVR